jgi:hypothetical protein
MIIKIETALRITQAWKVLYAVKSTLTAEYIEGYTYAEKLKGGSMQI